MCARAIRVAATAVVVAVSVSACGGQGSSEVSEDCVPEHEFETIDDGVLTVSTYPLPPFSNVEDRGEAVDGTAFTIGGTLVGVDGDILNEFAARECLEIEVHSTAAGAVLSAVQSGGADVGAGNWYRTTERAEILDLTDPIYLDRLAIIAPDGVSDFADLQDRRVGTVVGYQYVEDLRDYFAGDLVLYNSPLLMFRALEDGDIDAAVDTVGVGNEFTRENDLNVEEAEPLEDISASLEPGQSAFLVEQGHDDLLEALNATIESLREEGRLAEIMEENGFDESSAEPGEPRFIDG